MEVAMQGLSVGDRIRVFGGYDMDPQWLAGKARVEGVVLKSKVSAQNS
jgi:hypothetical protein